MDMYTFKCVLSRAKPFFFHLFLLQTRKAEVKDAVAMLQHNVPFAVAYSFSPLYKECFERPSHCTKSQACKNKNYLHR